MKQATTVEVDESQVTGRECRFVTHIQKGGSVPDTHVVKEVLHMKNGSRVRRLRAIVDFKRPFWLTKPLFRKHEQKKEYEDMDKLQKFTCTQSELTDTIARMLNKPNRGLRKLANSPYLYGTDILSTTLIKRTYMDKWPDLNTKYSVATLDLETTVGTREILVGTIAFENKVITAVMRSFVKRYGSDEEIVKAIREAMDKHIPDENVKKNLEAEIVVVGSEVELLRVIFSRCSEWSPDWLAIWNMDFDVPTMLDACERGNVHFSDIVCDPALPSKLRYFHYKPGRKHRETDSGKFVPIEPQDRWHVVTATSNFYWIDAMCAFSRIRTGESKMVGGYGLDNILTRVINQKKIKFEEAEGKLGVDWHVFMQENYPAEYVAYNQWDCISILELDKETNDLSTTLPTLAGASDFSIFNSQPKRIMDDFFFHLLPKGKVIASSPDKHSKVFKNLLGKHDWVITLPSHLMVENGLQVLKDAPNTRTNMRAHVYDIDAVSSYPSDIRAANVAGVTTMSEICAVEGISRDTFTKQNINLVVGKVNAVEYCTTMFGLPDLTTLGEMFDREQLS